MTGFDVEYRRMKLRRSTALEWTTDNPLLAVGEEGYETDTRKRKVGDGSTHWIDLHYSGVVDLIGSAAYVDTGSTVGTVPLLNSDNVIDVDLLGLDAGGTVNFLRADGTFAPPITSLTPSFTTPTLGSGVTVPSGGAPVRYTKDALGFVHIEGLVTFTGNAATAFTLPAGFRPAGKVQFMCGVASPGITPGVLVGAVSTAGVVTITAVPSSVTTTYVATLACIFFADA